MPRLGVASADLDRRYSAQEPEPGDGVDHGEDQGDKAESYDYWILEEVEKVGLGSIEPEGESVDEDETVEGDEEAGPLSDHVKTITPVGRPPAGCNALLELRIALGLCQLSFPSWHQNRFYRVLGAHDLRPL